MSSVWSFFLLFCNISLYIRVHTSVVHLPGTTKIRCGQPFFVKQLPNGQPRKLKKTKWNTKFMTLGQLQAIQTYRHWQLDWQVIEISTLMLPSTQCPPCMTLTGGVTQFLRCFVPLELYALLLKIMYPFILCYLAILLMFNLFNLLHRG